MSKITKIEIYKMNIDYSYNIKTSLGFDSRVENVLIKINTNSDSYGWGEASPYSFITGETQATCIDAAKFIGKLLIGKDPTNIEENTTLMKLYLPSHPSVRSAFDMAMWDILGKKSNLPLFKILGGKNRQLRTDMTMGLEETQEDVRTIAEKYINEGFNEIKMKTGRPGIIDFEHVRTVREIGGDKLHLKIDSNQGWDLAQSLKNARLMEPLNLMYFEQPLPAWNLEDMVRLREKIDIPVCADESVFDDKDAFKICKMGAADYLNIKLGKSGGIHMGLKINAIAESYGAKCMIGCFDETRLGLTAAVHLVLARPNIIFLDLDSSLCHKIDPIIGGIQFGKENKSLITMSETPGLGIDVKKNYLEGCDKFEITS
ncbi:MAG: dipeptide epimerase [Promethearchaeia archaeon]|nr:MAG: dipeptide epimerase [Candidatus Lokiarchaeia archaeon]